MGTAQGILLPGNPRSLGLPGGVFNSGNYKGEEHSETLLESDIIPSRCHFTGIDMSPLDFRSHPEAPRRAIYLQPTRRARRNDPFNRSAYSSQREEQLKLLLRERSGCFQAQRGQKAFLPWQGGDPLSTEHSEPECLGPACPASNFPGRQRLQKGGGDPSFAARCWRGWEWASARGHAWFF